MMSLSIWFFSKVLFKTYHNWFKHCWLIGYISFLWKLSHPNIIIPTCISGLLGRFCFCLPLVHHYFAYLLAISVFHFLGMLDLYSKLLFRLFLNKLCVKNICCWTFSSNYYLGYLWVMSWLPCTQKSRGNAKSAVKCAVFLFQHVLFSSTTMYTNKKLFSAMKMTSLRDAFHSLTSQQLNW